MDEERKKMLNYYCSQYCLNLITFDECIENIIKFLQREVIFNIVEEMIDKKVEKQNEL